MRITFYRINACECAICPKQATVNLKIKGKSNEIVASLFDNENVNFYT